MDEERVALGSVSEVSCEQDDRFPEREAEGCWIVVGEFDGARAVADYLIKSGFIREAVENIDEPDYSDVLCDPLDPPDVPWSDVGRFCTIDVFDSSGNPVSYLFITKFYQDVASSPEFELEKFQEARVTLRKYSQPT